MLKFTTDHTEYTTGVLVSTSFHYYCGVHSNKVLGGKDAVQKVSLLCCSNFVPRLEVFHHTEQESQ